MHLCLLVFLLSFSYTGSGQGPVDSTRVTRTVTALSAQVYDVKITITSPQLIQGFAKFSEYVPPGMEVALDETGDATTRFEKDYIKFIWTSYPAQHVVTVRYTITSPWKPDFDYKGNLSYVRNGEVTHVPVTPRDVSFVPKK